MLINIQILRGLAALWVFLHHSLPHFAYLKLSSPLFESIAGYGYMGVDVFFVISGLVIAKSIENTDFGYHQSRRFIIKRFSRIYLGFWPVFILTLALVYYFDATKVMSHELVKSFFLLGIIAEDLFIPPAWSLAFELYFYVLTGLMLLSGRFNHHLMFALLMILTVIKINWIEYGVNEALDLVFTPMLLEFLMGFYLWKYRHILIKPQWAVVFVGIMVFALWISVEYFLVATSFRPVSVGLFAFSLVALALIFESKLPGFLSAVLKPVGDSSYTLYLLHFLLLFLFHATGFRGWLLLNGYSLTGYLMLIISVVLISYVFYRLVEKPLYQVVSRRS
ncbi:acyltransferase family protein [Marinicella sediminis]|uniref:Acyltransferase family protein n=1 Tax=Marinicella sediminis TaxID=1792834 RepID=A0ABV7JBL3_9GAMM|nr:acyltransferase [Marinicella sediminis]